MYLALRDKNCKSVNTCMSTLKVYDRVQPQGVHFQASELAERGQPVIKVERTV